MAKYINADLLREKIVYEVEKWKEKTANHYTIEAEARWSEANYILLGIIDSLQQDQQKEPDKSLEEEIETWISAHISRTTDEILPLNPTELADVCKEWGKGIARHFAEWGAEHAKND